MSIDLVSRRSDLSFVQKREATSFPNENLLNRFVVLIHKDRPLYQQFFAYTAAALFAMTCVISILGIPLAWKLSQKIDQVRVQDKVDKDDAKVFNAIGGYEKYSQLPQLKIKEPFNEET